MKYNSLEEMLEAQRISFEARMGIRVKKGQDYANESNWLVNFENRAELFSILGVDFTKSYGVALADAILKIDRICNLVFRNQHKPNNESIRDTILDLKNYIDLMEECMLKEGVVE
jgi:hypothetical protein